MMFTPQEIGSHSYFIRCAALSPDRRLLATGDEDCLVKIWPVMAAGKEVRLSGHRDAVYCMQFVDDRILATGSWDRTVRLWDTYTGECLRVLRGHFDRIERVSSCAAKERIVSADEAGEVCEFDVTDGELLERWVIHENRVRAVAMWGTGGWVSAGDDGRVMIREWEETAPTQRAWLKTAIYGLRGPLADRRWVALGADGSVSALDMESGSLTTLIEDQVYLRTQDISPCRRRLACGGKSGVLRLWHSEEPTRARAVEVGESILELRWLSSTTVVGCGRNGMVFSAHLSPQGDWRVDRHFSYTDHVFALAADVRALRFYTAGFDGRVICWAASDDSAERGA